MIPLLLALAAHATTGFDPSSPAARFTDAETYTTDGAIKLWSAIERLEDPDRTLFDKAAFNDNTRWPKDSPYAPFVDDCFGTREPGTWAALLHMGPAEEVATGTPILMVPGAGDNASRGFVTMATRMDRTWRPVYALTFAHPHGDVFQQAEQVANAIARIKARTGAAQVDVVAHSKGGLAAAVYLSNAPGAKWGSAAYESVGTRYRGDVRRVVFVATPLAGIDTGYRWTAGNLASLDAATAISPTSWETYYPWGTTSPLVTTDLRQQDFLADHGDLFPGQRQLLARQDYPLPGSMPWLGAYALQPDWYTTYEGGYGFSSYSRGIDAAVVAGGDLIAKLPKRGVDADVEIFLLAGKNPVMPNAAGEVVASFFGDAWADMAENADAWGVLAGELVDDGLVDEGFTQEEIQGLASGDLMLGEITGESDGLVFVTSATREAAVTARGAKVKETYVANLSHLDLLYASPITGQLLIDAAAADPVHDGWMKAFGERYTEADTLGWVERVLADPEVDDTGVDDTGDTDTPDDTGDTDDTDPLDDTGGDGLIDGCEGCSTGGPVPGGALALALGAVLRRRARRAGAADRT